MNDLTVIEGEVETQSMAVALQGAEIQSQIATARTYPRSIKSVQNRVTSLATLDAESSRECIYALPRGGKPIKGPSVRFAEVLLQSYGNCRAAARVVHVDRQEMFVEAEGVFHDLETNSASTARVRRRIQDKNGRLFNDDMITVTGNAACAIAKRNAILGGIPRPIWRQAYAMAEETARGSHKTLAENIDDAKRGFGGLGVTIDELCSALGVPSEKDITTDHIVILLGMYSAIQNGEATIEEMFRSSGAPRRADMAERYAAKETESAPAQPSEEATPAGGGHAPAGAPQEQAAAVISDDVKPLIWQFTEDCISAIDVSAGDDAKTVQSRVAAIKDRYKADHFGEAGDAVQDAVKQILSGINDIIKGTLTAEDLRTEVETLIGPAV